MIYCPNIRHVVLNTSGIVLILNSMSLKHSIPFNLSVELDTKRENPRKLGILTFNSSVYKMILDIVKIVKTKTQNLKNNQTR